ncbi:MAG TPA: hypothetical protein VGB04_02435 [Allosphingosinicella sp.]|jgi:hypothetical protein
MTEHQAPWSKPLLKMIAGAHSPEAAAAFEAYRPDAAAWDTFREVSGEVLQDTRLEAGACTILSALLAKRLTAALNTPMPVIAGALKVGGQYVFGGNRSFDGAELFSEGSGDWDGHCWVLFGRHIVDVSLGRTARTGQGHPLLNRTVIAAYGNQVGLIAATEAEAREDGLLYLPRYVLRPTQVEALAAGAEYRYGIEA